jgi:uncharacterized protein
MSVARHHQPALRELSDEECRGLLAEQRVGRVGFVDRDEVVILPVTYLMDRQAVLFRTNEGSKLHHATSGHRVAFEVDGLDPQRRTGWSVLVKGTAETIRDPVELERVRELPLTPWAGPGKSHYVRILPSSVTGRRIDVGDALAALWWG